MARKPVDLKQFRHAVAILKKQGLIQNVDAKRAQPFWVRQGQRLSDTVKKYDDVVSGKLTAVKLPEKKTSDYRKAGYQISKGRIMVPHAAGETVKITPKKEIEIKHPSGMSRVKKAIPYQNLEQWLRDAKNNPELLDAEKGDKEYFAYKFQGYNSYLPYPNAETMLDDLVNGSVSGLNMMDKARHSTHKQQNELYQDLEIITIPRRGLWKYPKFDARGKMDPAEKASRAKKHQEWRRSLSGVRLAEYKRKARKRAKKSRDKKARK